MVRLFILIQVLTFLCAGSVNADHAKALFATGEFLEGNLLINGDTVTVRAGDRAKTAMLSELIFAKFPARHSPRIIMHGVLLSNGDLITGKVEILENRTVNLVSPCLGRRKIVPDKISKIILSKRSIFPVRRNRDISQGALLLNRDRMPGVVKWIAEGKVAIDTVMGLIEVPIENVAEIHIQPVTKQKAPGEFRIKLKNGDVLSGMIKRLDEKKLILMHTLFGELTLNRDFIKEIRAKSTAADLLSLIGEKKVEKTPYFDSVRDIRKDRNYHDDYLSIGSEIYEKGIIAMSRTRLVYTLGRKYTFFYAELGIDESVGSKGSVTFSVLINGRKAYQSPAPVTGSDEPVLLLLNIENAGDMEILIDFAQGGSIADFAVLGDALLIKKTK